MGSQALELVGSPEQLSSQLVALLQAIRIELRALTGRQCSAFGRSDAPAQAPNPILRSDGAEDARCHSHLWNSGNICAARLCQHRSLYYEYRADTDGSLENGRFLAMGVVRGE